MGGLVDFEGAAGIEVEVEGFGGLGWPFVEFAPGFSSGIEHVGFGEFDFAVSAEEGIEEWEFDFILEVLAGVGLPVVDMEFIAGGAVPHAVEPWSHDDEVVGLFADELGGFVASEGSVAVFGIKKSADPEHGALDFFELGGDGSCLPEIVVGVVPDDIVPIGDSTFVEFGVYI